MRDHYRYRLSGSGSTFQAFLWAPLCVTALLCLTFASCSSPRSEPRRTETELEPGWPKPNSKFQQVSLTAIRAAVPVIPGAEFVNDDELCLNCHKAYTETFQQNVHRGIHQEGQACEACHGPASEHLKTRGKEPGLILNFRTMQPAQASEVCMKCHEENACAPGATWQTSKHAHAGLSCMACHNAHYNVPPGTQPTTEPGEVARNQHGQPIQLASFQEPTPIGTLRSMSNNLGAAAPNTCFKCHGDLQESAMVAGPHQICGDNGLNCTTCHNSHGNILEYSRQDLCLQCHKQNSPTMAWHSSTHSMYGVACTDCHNPHPSSSVAEFPQATGVSFLHTNVQHNKKRAMSVQEPDACYKCHANVYSQFALPSHHPVKEGKMFCSDCHDTHGQRDRLLQQDGPNLLCYKCHADKQGPFAYEHAPVTEDCGICHQPHGTVANNLLRQPTTFLCLRCHAGHRNGLHGGPRPNTPPGTGTRANIDSIPQLRAAYYTDCTACHAQIHGSDLPSQDHMPGGMFR